MATAQVEERQLLKAMTWWDGFVVALANPGVPDRGARRLDRCARHGPGRSCSGRSRSAWARCRTTSTRSSRACSRTSRAASRCTRTRRWRKYLTLIGPLATFGYWIGWSVVLSVNGLVAGVLMQSEFFSSARLVARGRRLHGHPRRSLRLRPDPVVWLFNVYGVRPAVWFGYVTGGLLCIPAFVLMFLPYVTGDWPSSNMTWLIGSGGGLPLVSTWLYFMCWSAYGIEVVATFAPEFHDTQKDTPKALRSSALFCAAVYALLPLGSAARSAPRRSPTTRR